MQSFKGSAAGPIVAYSVVLGVDPPSLAAQTGIYVDIAVTNPPGCKTGQRVLINPTSDISTVGYTFGDARVSADNTVRVQCLNITAGVLNPALLLVNFVFFGKKANS